MRKDYFNMSKEELINEIARTEEGKKAIEGSTERLEKHRRELLTDIDKCEEAIQRGVSASMKLTIEIEVMREVLAGKFDSFVM